MSATGPELDSRTGSRSAKAADAAVQTSFETDATVLEGDRVIEKHATGSARSALRREASVLAQINSRFAIRFVELRETDDRTTMVTLDAGSRTLARAARLSNQELLRALGECVEAVRDLSAAGWQHGSLSTEHVIVGARGRIRLCSLGTARRLPGDESATTAATREDRPPVDITGLIRIVADVAAQDPVEDRWMDRRRRTHLNRDLQAAAVTANEILLAGGSPARVLSSLTDALGQVGETRTSAITRRSVPSTVGERASLDRLRRRDSRRSPGPQPRGIQLRTRSAALVMVAAATALGLIVLGVGGRSATTEKPESPRTSSHRTTAGRNATDAIPQSNAGPSSNVITVGRTLYSIGQAGDITSAGKWYCSDTTRVLLLRPSTGELYVFDRLAQPDVAVTGRLVAVHAGAVRIHKRTSGCETPILEMDDSQTIELDRETVEGTIP